ncbi:dendritic cell-specific transmembrane protein [Solea senegalensis]|uniref:Dendritic cell-specific transmembrane protein n=1 Tax=Solea senegalensis TaxID=28829 RepID=A0AAV6PUQ6_SOLSE|nr:dendritic cell-specific transmembrane protein [Solea senegalensis]KAG7475052.1 dendritic cell-specific transmembrane protein [Solea senegalensis]
MLTSWVRVKQSLEDVGSLAVDVFTTGKRDGSQRAIILLLTCSFSSLLVSTLLLLYLLYTLDYDMAVAGGIAGCFGTILTIALFLSKRVRCLGTLFMISIFMKKSRTLLLTAGTSLVVVKNIRNTLENLTGLLRSMICNLKAKKAAIAAPFSNYVKMLKWIGNMLKGITDLGVVNLDPQLKVSPRLESEKFQEKLGEAEQRLNETVKYVQSLVNTVSSVTDRMFPAISFLLLMLFIALHIKKYCSDMKYQNRFISSRFIHFDEKQKAEGKPHILPLTQDEREMFIALTSICPTARERKAVLKFGVSVVLHFVAWLIFITVDALLYCFVDIVTTKLSELEPFHVPLLMSIKGVATLIGITFNEEMHQKDFSYSVTLFEKKCLPKPKLLLYESIFPLAVILLILLIMALMAAKVVQLRLVVCERFFSTAAEERVEYLHAKILRKRLKRRNEENNCSLRSLIAKLHFWFPLLFRPKQVSVSQTNRHQMAKVVLP